MTIPAPHRMTRLVCADGPPDSRGRPAATYTPDPSLLLVIAIGPADSQETDQQQAAGYSDHRTVYLAPGQELTSRDRVIWSGAEWQVLTIADYEHGPWPGPGGTVATIGRTGVTNA